MPFSTHYIRQHLPSTTEMLPLPSSFPVARESKFVDSVAHSSRALLSLSHDGYQARKG